VAAAARAAGINRTTAYAHRNANPEFAEAWDNALEESTEELIGECYRRAREGTERPVFYGGKQVGTVREYSDAQARFLLKCHRPSVYGDKIRTEHSGPDGGQITIDVTKLTDDQLCALILEWS
jgi:hypothetical protein